MNIIDNDVIFAMAKNIFYNFLEQQEEKRKDDDEDKE